MTQRIEARLKELGIELPEAMAPMANYIPATRSGAILFISGQICQWNGERRFIGKLGRDFAVEQGREAARLCGLNLLAQVKRALDGDLDRVTRVLKLTGFVNAVPEFGEQPQVVNGASDLMVEVLGDAGRHARSAIGVGSLPAGVAIEVEGIFEVR
jgi:enamine deaminase RidA (YjgF/YER057c/UK114 family)